MAEIKFTEEDITSLNELSQKYQSVQMGFGQIRVQKILLDQQKANLEEAEAKLEADKVGLNLINGVEISALWRNMAIHILGLGIDINKVTPYFTIIVAIFLVSKIPTLALKKISISSKATCAT